MPYYSNYLAHYGVKGMKWGVRRYRNADGSLTREGMRRYAQENARVLKKGTEIQNISSRRLDPKNKRSNRLYASYTPYDKDAYTDFMAGFQYDNKGWKNSFVVKKDIKIASERDVVNTMAEMFRDNPKRTSEMMAKAYNAASMPILFKKTGKGYQRKLSELEKDPTSKKAMKLGREFIGNVPMSTKTSSFANDFYARMAKKGFDAVLDSNDAYGGMKTQDPLIIFNMNKLGKQRSIKLTKEDIEAAGDYSISREHRQQKKDYSSVAR